MPVMTDQPAATTPHRPTLMTVHAHPDDETIGTGGAMAKAVDAGHRVVLVTCTRGELGEIVVAAMDTPDNHRRLGEIRAGELERAMGVLGVTEWETLGYRDSGMMGTHGNHDPALFSGTAVRLGSMLRDGAPYYYYAKTGTTGDDEIKTKSKLLAVIISAKDITDPDFNFRNNKFYIIYFTSQNGPAKQNEEFQAEVIRYVQKTLVFDRYMKQ